MGTVHTVACRYDRSTSTPLQLILVVNVTYIVFAFPTLLEWVSYLPKICSLGTKCELAIGKVSTTRKSGESTLSMATDPMFFFTVAVAERNSRGQICRDQIYNRFTRQL